MAENSAELPNGLLNELKDTLIDNFGDEDTKGVMRIIKTILLKYWPNGAEQAQDDILHFEAGWHCEMEAHVSSKAGFRTITLRDGGRTLKLRVSGAFAPKLKAEI